MAPLAGTALNTPLQSPAACTHLRLKVEVDSHLTESGPWCHLLRQYIVCGRQGTCVLCREYDETALAASPWDGEAT